MADVTVRASLIVKKNSLDYSSRPTSFTASLTGELGPTPGAFLAVTGGTNADLSELTTGGYVLIRNLEATGGNFVTWGEFSGAVFHLIGELGPGEFSVFKFSRTFVSGSGELRFVADTASVNVSVEAFEK